MDDLGAADPALTSPEGVDPSYGGYAATGYSEPQAGTAQGYRMMPARSGLASLSALGARVLNRSDLLPPHHIANLPGWSSEAHRVIKSYTQTHTQTHTYYITYTQV